MREKGKKKRNGVIGLSTIPFISFNGLTNLYSFLLRYEKNVENGGLANNVSGDHREVANRFR